MKMKFTPEQQRVIDTRNKNILVSAAAGSGKTAVLVERIIQMVTESDGGEPAKQPVDIDRLLVVTFTQAAAAEMRERIGAAVERKLAENPESAHLQKQAALMHNAQITTIDSFCLFVLRNNFNDIGLDPGFRVADEGEIRLLQQDVLAGLLEEYFEKEDEQFYHLVESFSPSGSEKPLAEQVLKLFQFAMSFPWPEEWLKECAEESYDCVEALEQSGWMQTVLQDCETILEDALLLLERAREICESPDGPYMYCGTLEGDAAVIDSLRGRLAGQNAGDGVLQGLYETLAQTGFGRLPGKRDESVSAEKREQVKGIRQEIKDAVTGLRERFFYQEPQDLLAAMQRSQENIRKLTELVLRFKEEFEEAKRDKNIIDFQDMEHMALQILVRRENGRDVATGAALQYRDYFAEVLIDEYQDSNLVQEALLKSVSREETGGYNRFMVGDVKQSIYKFRLARPELFLEKYDTYAKEDGEKIRIDLHKNFRSRTQVLDSVNLIFEKIMGSRLGRVEYDAQAALYPGASYEAGKEPSDYRTELLLFDTSDTDDAGNMAGQEAGSKETEEEAGQTMTEGQQADSQKSQKKKPLSKKEAEAKMIAARIQELHGTLMITDKSGVMRPAAYRDMVILLRSNQGWDDVFLRVLREEGIPAHAASKTGYFSAVEIQTLLHFLRIIDNPLQDIPLYGVLKSALGGFTEQELALIRSGGGQEAVEEAGLCGQTACSGGGQETAQEEGAGRREKPKLYEALAAYRGNEIMEEKARKFLQQLARYRKMAVYTSISRLLQKILEETGYLYEVGALPGGQQRQANVEMLLSRAADFEQTSYCGLFHFIRYMEQMEKYEIDYGEANIMDENADTVRIMSIHKSKGLEFPICFVAGLSKRFNRMDTNRALLMDVDYGIGAESVDTKLRLSETTLKKNALGRKLLLDAQGEELRVLYVAMTRAREKLILTAAVDHAAKKEQESAMWDGKAGNQESGTAPRTGGNRKLPFLLLSEAGSYLDWLLPAMAGEEEIERRIYTEADLVQQKFIRAASGEYNRLRLQAQIAAGVDYKLSQQLCDRFAFTYPHNNLEGLYTKTTVSELKKAGMEAEEEADSLFREEEMIPYIPRFMEEKEEVSATARGTAYHRVMELLDYAGLPEKMEERAAWLKKQMEENVSSGRLTQSQESCISLKKAGIFLQSGLAGRMSEADKKGVLYREQPFVLGIGADRLRPQFPKEETVLVQGIIDVYFEEQDYLVVADYKTDRVAEPEELVHRYRVQLDYYAQALERLTGKPVRERILYSFALGREIVV